MTNMWHSGCEHLFFFKMFSMSSRNTFLQVAPRKRLIVPLCRISHVQDLVWRVLLERRWSSIGNLGHLDHYSCSQTVHGPS